MAGIPPALQSDSEDVAWALQTAEALWKRNERVDALVWLRRAAQAAGDAEDDDRALALAHNAAELAEWIALHRTGRRSERPVAAVASSLAGSRPPARVAASLVSSSAPPPLPFAPPPSRRTSSHPPPDALQNAELAPAPPVAVPTAAELHAGMLDPWAEAENSPAATEGQLLNFAKALHPAVPPDWEASLPSAAADDIVTSAPPVVGKTGSVVPNRVPRPGASEAPLDLSRVLALGDLPDDAREAFARCASCREIEADEEVSGFALALVIRGSLDVSATILDATAVRLEAGEVVRGRGTIATFAALRLVASRGPAKIATWAERDVDHAFRSCPWVEDELRAAGDRVQALVGATMGRLGERLDADLRSQVTGRLSVRVLAEHEILARAGQPIPGLVVVGAGELVLLGTNGAPNRPALRAGDFLFPSEVLCAGVAPSNVRASKGGALVLVADRPVAQELFVTYPLLLELFAEG